MLMLMGTADDKEPEVKCRRLEHKVVLRQGTTAQAK